MKSLEPKHQFPRRTPKIRFSLILLTFARSNQTTHFHELTPNSRRQRAILNVRTNKGKFNTSVKAQFTYFDIYTSTE